MQMLNSFKAFYYLVKAECVFFFIIRPLRLYYIRYKDHDVRDYVIDMYGDYAKAWHRHWHYKALSKGWELGSHRIRGKIRC